MINKVKEYINEYILEIWRNPNEVMTEKLGKRKMLPLVILSILTGIFISYAYTIFASFGDTRSFSFIVPFWVISGTIVGIVGVYIFGGILKMTSDFFGGKADDMETRTVLAWSFFPYVITGVIALTLSLAVFNINIFTSRMSYISANGFIVLIYLAIIIAYFGGLIVSISMLIESLSRINGYSKSKALLILLVSAIIFAMIVKIFINILT